jgi:hypothetical protein
MPFKEIFGHFAQLFSIYKRFQFFGERIRVRAAGRVQAAGSPRPSSLPGERGREESLGKTAQIPNVHLWIKCGVTQNTKDVRMEIFFQKGL